MSLFIPSTSEVEETENVVIVAYLVLACLWALLMIERKSMCSIRVIFTFKEGNKID